MRKYEHDSFHVGVKALIFDAEGRVLLLERDHPIKKLYWDLPGGRLQKGESLMDTLLREVKEETGLNSFNEAYHFTTALSDIRIPIQDDSVGLIFFVFRLNLSSPFQPILSNEHIDFGWFTPFEASQKLKEQYPIEFIEKLTHIPS
ncbi:MAG: NUDIX hydrolase [Parachlamydiaceae bacterium]|nr:NUDIX hydrolase [Parachlamydiaceae bacterium]